MPERPEGEERSPQDPESGQDLITRDTPVRAAWSLRTQKPLVVPTSAGLRDVARSIAECRGIGTVAVANEDGRLVGVIPLRLLLDELFFRVAPEGFLAGILAESSVGELGKISTANTAGQLMEPPAYITMDQSVGEAYEMMRERRLEGLPIVDAQMKPVGYLDRIQLLSIWLETHPS